MSFISQNENDVQVGILYIQGQEYPIYNGINLIGRSQHCSVVLSDPTVSKTHAQVIFVDNKHFISDLNSTNPTLLSGIALKPLKCYLITDNTDITFGSVQAKYKILKKQEMIFKIPNPISKISSISELNETQRIDSKTIDIHELETQLEINISTECTTNIHEMPTQIDQPTQSIPISSINKSDVGKLNHSTINESILVPETQVMDISVNKTLPNISINESDLNLSGIKELDEEDKETSNNDIPTNIFNDSNRSDSSSPILNRVMPKRTSVIDLMAINVENKMENDILNIDTENDTNKYDEESSDTDFEDNVNSEGTQIGIIKHGFGRDKPCISDSSSGSVNSGETPIGFIKHGIGRNRPCINDSGSEFVDSGETQIEFKKRGVGRNRPCVNDSDLETDFEDKESTTENLTDDEEMIMSSQPHELQSLLSKRKQQNSSDSIQEILPKSPEEVIIDSETNEKKENKIHSMETQLGDINSVSGNKNSDTEDEIYSIETQICGLNKDITETNITKTSTVQKTNEKDLENEIYDMQTQLCIANVEVSSKKDNSELMQTQICDVNTETADFNKNKEVENKIYLTQTQKCDLIKDRIDSNENINENEIFLMPTQKCGVNTETADLNKNKEENEIYLMQTQKCDLIKDRIDSNENTNPENEIFLMPTQKCNLNTETADLNKNKEVENEIYLMQTQKCDLTKETIDSNTENEIFLMPTQKCFIEKDMANKVNNAPQKNSNQEAIDEIYTMETQICDFNKEITTSSCKTTDAENNIYLKETQVCSLESVNLAENDDIYDIQTQICSIDTNKTDIKIDENKENNANVTKTPNIVEKKIEESPVKKDIDDVFLMSTQKFSNDMDVDKSIFLEKTQIFDLNLLTDLENTSSLEESCKELPTEGILSPSDRNKVSESELIYKDKIFSEKQNDKNNETIEGTSTSLLVDEVLGYSLKRNIFVDSEDDKEIQSLKKSIIDNDPIDECLNKVVKTCLNQNNTKSEKTSNDDTTENVDNEISAVKENKRKSLKRKLIKKKSITDLSSMLSEESEERTENETNKKINIKKRLECAPSTSKANINIEKQKKMKKDMNENDEDPCKKVNNKKEIEGEIVGKRKLSEEDDKEEGGGTRKSGRMIKKKVFGENYITDDTMSKIINKETNKASVQTKTDDSRKRKMYIKTKPVSPGTLKKYKHDTDNEDESSSTTTRNVRQRHVPVEQAEANVSEPQKHTPESSKTTRNVRQRHVPVEQAEANVLELQKHKPESSTTTRNVKQRHVPVEQAEANVLESQKHKQESSTTTRNVRQRHVPVEQPEANVSEPQKHKPESSTTTRNVRQRHVPVEQAEANVLESQKHKQESSKTTRNVRQRHVLVEQAEANVLESQKHKQESSKTTRNVRQRHVPVEQAEANVSEPQKHKPESSTTTRNVRQRHVPVEQAEANVSEPQKHKPESSTTTRNVRQRRLPIEQVKANVAKNNTGVKATKTNPNMSIVHEKKQSLPFSEVKTPLQEFPKRFLRKYAVMFTLYRNEHQEQVVKQLGGSVVTDLGTEDVLVTDNIRRTAKVLVAISKAKPIVSPDWLTQCEMQKRFVDPWEYLLKDKKAEYEFKFNLVESINLSKQKCLLKDYKIHVTANAKYDEMKKIIEHSGGKCLANFPKTLPKLFFVISCEEDSSKWPPMLKKNKDLQIVSNEALFSALIRQKIELNLFNIS